MVLKNRGKHIEEELKEKIIKDQGNGIEEQRKAY